MKNFKTTFGTTRSISRRDLYALGEPLGESVTRARLGGRVYGGGGGTAITNWAQGNTDMLTPWQQSVWANSAAAAGVQAADNNAYRVWYTAQRQQEITLMQAAMIAVKTAIDIAIVDKIDKRMREIAKDQRDLADRQLKMGEELHARYVNKFAPIEDAAADFAKNDWEKNRYKPQYLLHQGRAKLDAARAFGKVAGKLNKKMSRYCTGANANMLRMVHTDWARMEVDMTNRAYRFEEAQMWNRDDLQWRRLQNAIANGQRLPSQAAADIASGIRTATESNAIRGQAMQGWYGALASASNGLFRYGYGALQEQKQMEYRSLAGMARNAGFGSLGTTGIQYEAGSFGYNSQSFNSDTAGAVSVTSGDATGAGGSSFFDE